MEVNVNKFRQAVHWLREHVQTISLSTADNRVLQNFLELEQIKEHDIQSVLNWLSSRLLDKEFTEQIAVNFEEFLLLLLSKCLERVDDKEVGDDFQTYQQKCIALAKLLSYSIDAKRFATNYFRNKPAPFEIISKDIDGPPRKKPKNVNISTYSQTEDLAILRCCYQLLNVDASYYKELWNWSPLVEKFLNSGQHISQLEQLYFNHILAILTNMSSKRLSQLNANIKPSILLQFDDEQNIKPKAMNFQIDKKNPEVITFNFKSDTVSNIGGVLLPVFNKENYQFYAHTDGVHEQIVKVDSTKANLRSIAMGIAAAKTICLSGPVGCGKTTLVQYLARKTGRICPKAKEIESQKLINKENTIKPNGLGEKTIIKNTDESLENSLTDLLNLDLSTTNGFLRIQLGDQTDSKMLLGQYRCTDVPGEFIWLPGILTQAVMNGLWLLLEDLDSATPDTYTILSGLLENNYLSVPGFRDCVKIQPGFQLFVTVRTNKSSSSSAQKALLSLLEKYLYTINILPLSRNELCKVVSTNYPKLATVANRIVDVFLTFSSGDHNVADNLRQQETGDKADNTEKYVSLPFESVSLASIPNAGRLVSTRDLIKLCQRSNPVFSVTSTECAYFVFQNAVDVFCSNLPQGKEKTKLIVSIGAKLGIIQSRCETYADDYKPEISVDFERIKVGRAELYTRTRALKNVEDNELEGIAAKRQKLSLDAEKCLAPQKRATFSFTRLASCILERIAICVAHAEPVLLVGETGVGKTSSVQYLAERTEHKLVVVNMNNQSDVSDLIGSFKPVDLTYVISPLRDEFECLFRETYDPNKNATFLSKFGSCYNENLFTAIVKMMIKVTDAILLKSERNQLPTDISVLIPRWQYLKTKLVKLDTQLSKSINISFAFIPGSLVNCIKNGDWVLLDEINLASAETLECLSTILEPDGSVVLLERGDFTPVSRHADFRIFACMNPNTDIGKKDLPVGIRNRFTEFFVDELTTDNDLSLLITDYLINTGIQRKSVTNIVKLYKKLRQMAKLDLNDGLGNRPVYSLRTLCRSLRICAKNLCGSIERNLYESFCLSFLTQLDTESHKIVLNFIQAALLSNVKAVLRQSIPKPGENYLDFEGYWIEQGPKPLQECSNYILTESVKANLKDLARIISIGKLPILLQGPTSAGKTSLIEYVAKRSGNHCLRINNHEHTDLQEYIGTYVADATGNLSFREGVLVQAMRNGYWIILDELNLASTEILEALNRVLDDNRELFIPETQCVVKAHPNFMLFATQNPPGLYGGRKTLSRAFKNRFIELHFSEIPRHELEIILEKRCFIPPSYAKKMVMCMADLQKHRSTTSKNVFTLRDLFRWGNRYTFADKRLLEDKKYDWNQHLVEEGYLVLSAKVRTDLEIQIIEDALYRNFKKRLDLTHLFDVNIAVDQRSPVTANIIEAINTYRIRSDIVWTRNMTRMAVLTAKALQFDEPVLLVGPTGCGKTTVCQLLAGIHGVRLRILNCHMHTEGADFLGGLRPYRQNNSNSDILENGSSQTKLFEWADGPLINAMQEGSYFMADEISLAEDSVLERLNCILEPERTVLLAEKGGVAISDEHNELDVISSNFVIQAQPGFQFLATMNPGGDFGKKELSPALRNRFTEIWCLPSDTKEDLIQIASNCMSKELSRDHTQNIANYLVEVVLYIRDNVEKFKFSIRDILAWANYIMCNGNLSFSERAIFGLETIFLDALEMLPHESLKQVETIRKQITRFALNSSTKILNEKFTIEDLESKRGTEVLNENGLFGLKPFLIPINSNTECTMHKEFSFSAPTTKKNLFRLLSALSLQKPILLEGPPGVGKTSTVENLARAIGFQIVRINLCEHTDLADLFGTDLPAEDNVFSTQGDVSLEKTTAATIGSFVWRDGPLLAALKANNTWILLDELNLAPQSVLEGLNAILDHRGEVFIPELNKTFALNKSTRIFACQNPLRQGGGRKGLPQSFLNRFNKVYLRKLTTEDLKYVIDEKYGAKFEDLKEKLLAPLVKHQLPSSNLFELRSQIKKISLDSYKETDYQSVNFDLSVRLVRFSEALDQGVSQMEFGYKGGPYEFNLRDILRWCEFLMDSQTGVHLNNYILQNENVTAMFESNFDSFLQTLYDTMKLVYIQRMRTVQDQDYIRAAFGRIFNCNAAELNKISEDVSLYWSDEHIYLNDLVLRRDAISQQHQIRAFVNKDQTPLILFSQREHLHDIISCVQHQKPVLLCGSSDTGKTKLIDSVCTLSDQVCNTDNIDDSVTGSFQQIDLNRHLEDLANNVECIFWSYIQNLIFDDNKKHNAIPLLVEWYKYTNFKKRYNFEPKLRESVPKDLQLYQNRLAHILALTKKLLNQTDLIKDNKQRLTTASQLLEVLQKYTNNVGTLNMGGSFEWVDSKIVNSLKYGQYIALEHVNLCSSAVLDRLNPIFEPNGNLLISEKGVSTTETAEIVEKSPNFRAFLTIDPKNGELSRAMRNRCVEIALQKDNYSCDDMRQIIYTNGVHDITANNCILWMHNSIKELTEINSFSVSHLNHCAFLVASYKRIGYSTARAIYVSGMEVYVYAANVDLLGYGLTYYQNKLRDIVLEHMTLYIKTVENNDKDKEKEHEDYLAPLILRCGDLNKLTMIKWQTMPLNLLLQTRNINEIMLYLKDIENLNGFDRIDLECFLRFYIYLLYEISTFGDLELRQEYLLKILLKHPMQRELSHLSASLTQCFSIFKSNFQKEMQHLPWNTNFFPRIRDYTNVSNNSWIYRLSGSLIKCTVLQPLPPKNETNLKIINALVYAKRKTQKYVPDKSNTFLNLCSVIIDEIQRFLDIKITTAVLDESSLMLLTTKFLWLNRLLSLAQIELVKRNEIDVNLLNKLMLHYEWVCKHLLQYLAQLSGEVSYREFSYNFIDIDEYIATVKPKLNRLCKLYVKHILAFQPYYKTEQLNLHKLTADLDQLLCVIPSYGCFTPENVLKKFMCQKEHAALKARELISKINDNNEIIMPPQKITTPLPKILQTKLQGYIDKSCNHQAITEEQEIFDMNELNNEIEIVKKIINSEEELNEAQKPLEIELGLHAIREYYLTKALVQNVESIFTATDLNFLFCEELPTLCSDSWQLIRMKQPNALFFLNHLMEYIQNLKMDEINLFKDIIESLKNSYKELNALWRDMVYKSQRRQLFDLSTHLSTIQAINNNNNNNIEELNSVGNYEGPALVNTCLELLFQNDGSLKSIPLKDLHAWKHTLNQINQIMWQNALLITHNFEQLKNNTQIAQKHAKKLLLEITYTCAENIEMDENYQKLLTALKVQLEQCIKVDTTKQNTHAALQFRQQQYETALLNALIGAIELSTLTSMPLIDPVEKKRLKKLYLGEDISTLTTLSTVYDVMRIVLKYKNFGNELYQAQYKQIQILKAKQMKQNQNLALRPRDCLYKQLIEHIKHYLNTNCRPAMLIQLIEQVKLVRAIFEPSKLTSTTKALNKQEICCETIMKLTLWISNSQHFICHVLKPYAGYYEDFLQPLRCAVQQFTFGLIGLKTVLYQLEHSRKDTPNHSNEYTHQVVGSFAEFPNTRIIKSTPKSSNASANNINERLRMLRLKLDALSKHVHIAKEFNIETFEYLCYTLDEYNELWQLEEEQLRRLKAEEDSLYVHKTKCETEDEDMVEQQEIEEYFPTHVVQDYGDYLNTDTLEQTKKISIKSLNTKPKQMLNDDIVNNIAQEFIELLEQYTQISYYNQQNRKEENLDFVSMARKRLQTFVTLFKHHKLSLNDWLDGHAYNGLCLAVSLQERRINEVPHSTTTKSKTTNCYNFYRDSNIPEIVACTELLERIRALVKIQLDLYPEHASLLDVEQIIVRILQLPSNAPLVRFSTGFQLLRQKVSQWNEVAHKNNHLRNEELELAEYVQKWMRLELQCWRNSLNQTQNQVEAHAYRYWFFIYNLLQEYMQTEKLDSSYTDMKYAEKRFAESEILDASDVAEKQQVGLMDILRILRQFIEAACYGDFHVRMRLLQAFELYLQCKRTDCENSNEPSPKLEYLIAGLHNLQIYFSQFAQEINESRQAMRAPIEKKLKEFVKIESYNKDLSYFNMRNNIARVHRNLNKFLKEYRVQLQQKITTVFQPQDITVKDYNCENVKGKTLRFDSKVKYNLMLDVKYFMASEELKLNFNISKTTENANEMSLLSKADKHFLTSRNVVKSIIQYVMYPQMVMALDELLTTQLERCEHLRSLNVDRTKDRPKQKLEAKQILQQKRKGLSDLFKILTQLGISYKAGLLEQNLNTQFVDYTLPPFCVRNMLCESTKDKQVIYANMLQLYEHIDRYYAKSVFKLKLLQNVMLTPLSELGPPFIERIKGFAVSMFLLVQQQRRLLAETTRECYDLKCCLKQLRRLTNLVNDKATTSAQLSFAKHIIFFGALKCATTQIRYILEQFAVLINCAPKQACSTQQVFTESLCVLTKDTHEHGMLTKICDKALDEAKQQLQQMAACDIEFLSYTQVQNLKLNHEAILKLINNMLELCYINSTAEYIPLATPLITLLAYVNDTLADTSIEPETENMEIVAASLETTLNEILHNILISLQKLYKQYPKPDADNSKEDKSTSSKRNTADDAAELQEQHMKSLYNSLNLDWCNLNVGNISQKLTELLRNTSSMSCIPTKLEKLQKLCTLLPLLEQYYLMAEYQLLQQLGAHKVSAKMLSIMLTVFVEVSTKGFCVPPDLMHDEEQGERKKDQKEGEGFGLEDGTGEKDASDKIESEDQLDDAKRPEDRKNDKDNEQQKQDCKEEKGIEMSEDFDAEMQDIEKPEDGEEDDSGESENEDELNKEMGETEEGAEKLDDQIWGDDEEPKEKEEEEPEMQEEDDGKGSKDEKDAHNDLDTKNDAAKNKDDTDAHDKDGLDATNEAPEEDKRKQQKQDIDNMKDPELDEDQPNPYHNELEEPPEAEEMDLSDMNNNEAENDGDNEQEDNENPFDIDSMKQNMIETKDENGDETDDNDEKNKNEDDNGGDSSEDSDDEPILEHDKNKMENDQISDENEEEDDNKEKDDEPETQRRGELDEEEQQKDPETEQEKHEEKPEEHAPSKDKSSEEKNVQSMPNTDDKASVDQAPNEQDDKDIRQEQKLDEQETGEEKDGVGQAENEDDDGGHQGIADTKETISKENQQNEPKNREKRKQGHTNEERTLGEAEKNKLKQLKTIDKLKENNEKEPDDGGNDEKDLESEEYQHVKEPKNSDKTTLDNATEEQSKKIQPQEDEKNEEDDENANEAETHEDLMETDEHENNEELQNLEEMSAEKNDKKSEKLSKSEKTQDRTEPIEQMEVEGEIVLTMTVPRKDDTTAHCNQELLLDTTQADEMTTSELLKMRKLYQQQLGTNQVTLPEHEHYETWLSISNRMSQNARELCEQLRLILEPTKCTRLKGDYRTGRRINMKKIIPYIASQFRKDKIWLRRTKPAQRDYKITIAIDDSKSMHHNNSKVLTLEAISLISQALTFLESGRLSVISFGEAPKIILNHTEQFDGPKLVNALNFEQGRTKIAELLDFIRTVNTEEGASGSDNGLFENLLLVLSDGRNIFSEGRAKVKNSIKLARLQRIFLVYVIIDNPENKNSILDIQTMEILPDTSISIKSYLDDFPFPYYVIVRDLNQLPLVLSEAMRQWFELVNSEQ